MSETRAPDVHRKLKAVAKTVAQALPYMRRYADKTVVVKYGGHAMGDAEMTADFAADVALLKQVGINVVLVHGGGPQIGAMLERLKIETNFVDGLRVTDRETVDIVEMVLSGSVNKSLVAAIAQAGGNAVGLSGKDGGFIRAKRLTRSKPDPGSNIEKVLDLGFVGEPELVNAGFIQRFLDAGLIPVIAPIGLGEEGETYNINADTVAGAVAAALNAERLLLLTDVPGVLDEDKELIPESTVKEIRSLIESGVISGGMIPKAETCIKAVENGVSAAVIIDGRAPHALLLEIFTKFGAGTLIRATSPSPRT